MATRSKPNWKVLDTLLPIFEKEGWSHAQIAEDWGISLVTLEAHLHREGESMSAPLREIDWQRFDELKAQGLPMLRISKEMQIPEATLRQRAQRRDMAHQSTPKAHQDTPEAHPSTPYEAEVLTVHPGTPNHTERSSDEQDTQEHLSTPTDSDLSEVHPGTLEGHQEVMEDISQTVPDVPHISTEEVHQSTPEHPSTPEVHQELSPPHSGVPEHSSVPVRQQWPAEVSAVHPGTPTEEDWQLWERIKERWEDMEMMLSIWHLKTLRHGPRGTPRHTMKKTYVVDSLYVELIDRYAQDTGAELKDIVNAAFQEFFSRRDYLPKEDEPPR